MVEQHFDSWADEWIAKGFAQGFAKGFAQGFEKGFVKGFAQGFAKGEERDAEAGRKELLVKLVRKRFGAGTAAVIAPLLDEVHSLPALDEIGLSTVDGSSADDLLAKLRKL